MDADYIKDLEDQLHGLDESINELTVELGLQADSRASILQRIEAARRYP